MSTHGRARSLILGLGTAQLVAWGTLYYAIAIIGEPMRLELGVREHQLFGAFAWSLAVSGFLAPWAGRVLDRVGGRRVLGLSVVVGAAGFLVLSRAQSLATVIVGWSINGIAMALGLYDTCFAAVGQQAPHAYRRIVTGVTLIAGFASTVAWPVSHLLVESMGWRSACAAFSLALLGCLPIYAAVLPNRRESTKAAPSAAQSLPSSQLRRQARVLAAAFAGVSLVGAALSAHLVGILKALEFSALQAVWLASSIGGLQVLGRLLDLALGGRHDTVRIGALTFGALAVAVACLFAALALPSFVFAFVLLYGLANGVVTIVRAALPVEMFGVREIGGALGGFSAPSLVARALGPLLFASVASAHGPAGSLAGLVTVTAASFVAYAVAVRAKRNGRGQGAVHAIG